MPLEGDQVSFPALPASFEEDSAGADAHPPSNSSSLPPALAAPAAAAPAAAAQAATAAATAPAQDIGAAGWFRSMLTWFWHAPAAPSKAPAAQRPAARAELLRVARKGSGEDRMRWRTNFEATDDRQRDIPIADAFGQLEQEDEDEVESLHREDVAARTEAEHKPLELAQGGLPVQTASTRVSNFWKAMESEDSDMGKALDQT